MKPLTIFFFLVFTLNVSAQNYSALTHIDSIVSVINASPKNLIQDSTIQAFPEYGLSVKTYISALIEEKQLKKYTSHGKTDRVEAGITKHLISHTTFYYFDNKLIKVEELSMEGNNVYQFFWYFQNDKCLYQNAPPPEDKDKDRPTLLLAMAKAIAEKMLARP